MKIVKLDKLLKNIVFVVFVFSLQSCKNSNEENLPEVMKKLEGTWQLENSNTFEKWENHDSLFIGQVVNIHNTDTTIQENLRILKIDSDIFYEATVLTQNNGLPVRFKLNGFDKNGLTFVNKKHDFPKEIIYNLHKNKTFHATISGNDKSISFKYLKIK